MRLRDKVVVPQLSTATQARVEARFVAAVRDGEARRHSFFNALRPLAVGVAVAGVAIAIAINVKSATDSRAVVTPTAQASITEVQTGEDSVTLRVGDATVLVAAASELSIVRHASGETRLALQRGRVDCEVEPVPDRAPFYVGASDVTVRVVGTVFSVEHDQTAAADIAVSVAVTRGRVAVSSSAGEVVLDAGSAWNARDGVAVLVAALDPAGIEPGADPGASDAPASALEGRDATTPPSVNPSTVRKSTAVGKTERPQKPARPAVLEHLPRPGRQSAPAAGDLDEAMTLEAKEPREAIRVYTRIATKTHGDVASFALYSRAYVEYVRLGDRAASLRTLSLFRRRFPRARESESALWLQIKALCELDRHAACRSAAHSYMRRYADGRFAAAAKQIVDDLSE